MNKDSLDEITYCLSTGRHIIYLFFLIFILLVDLRFLAFYMCTTTVGVMSNKIRQWWAWERNGIVVGGRQSGQECVVSWKCSHWRVHIV